MILYETKNGVEPAIGFYAFFHDSNREFLPILF